jgi:2-C-methyl-D-erythritol 4-phosphate cytidylyltransferase/2-C-methyl-D-erythritol 2,4-cyclodiphosphate synthase
MTSIVALVVAAGRGTRAGTGATPKQYVDLGGRMVLTCTIEALLAHPAIDRVRVVIHPDDHALYRAAVDGLQAMRIGPPIQGGADRQASVRLGLDALADDPPGIVLIHDAARPFVTRAALDRLLAALTSSSAAILASALTDTLKRQADKTSAIAETIPRAGLWRAETPQAFRFADIHALHRRALVEARFDFTDDASLAETAGMEVALVDSGGGNVKLTTPDDIAFARARLSKATMSDIDVRTGQGFDVHRFKDGDHVMLCGVRIAHTHGVDAHSDGDVGLHALTDALLGAIADGDIGQHFKNTDPRWAGQSSDLFLADAARRVRDAGGRITHVDVTILCEAPKIAPHREAMRARAAAILDLDVSRVSIKATTTERLGFAGRGEGLAALATATVVMSR